MIISTPIFEAYLKCPSKCWFLFLDKKGDANIYSDFLRKRNNAYRVAGIERLMAKIQPGECVVTPSIPVNIKTATWLLAKDLVARKETFESCLHAVERMPTDGQSKPAQFIPIRFIFTNRVTKDDKLVLAFDALALSETLRMEVSHGKIVYCKCCNSAKIKTSILAGTLWQLRNGFSKTDVRTVRRID